MDRLLTAVFALMRLSALCGALESAACLQQSSLVDIVTDPTGPLVTTKSGGSAIFSMYLSGVALGSAIVELDSTAPALGQPVPSTLYFAQNAWRTPQQVSIVGRDDGVAGNEAYALNVDLHGTSFLVAYTQASQVPLQIVSVDDVASMVVARHANADGATLDVMLRTPPQDIVSVTLQSGQVARIEPSELVFTPQDANVAQTVNVEFAANMQPFLSLVAASDDPRYDGVNKQVPLPTH